MANDTCELMSHFWMASGACAGTSGPAGKIGTMGILIVVLGKSIHIPVSALAESAYAKHERCAHIERAQAKIDKHA
eukprot:scaffold63021_cov24-Tisochrysis_lutea.AAC.4